MSDAGWIYIPNWDRHYANPQKARRDPPLPWIKNMTALTTRDDYISLSLAHRGLLHGIWMLVGLHGNGRVSSRMEYITRQLRCRNVSLEPLIHAGFIEVHGTKALPQKREEENRTPLPPQEGEQIEHQNGRRANGTNRRALDQADEERERRVKLIQQCKRLYAHSRAEGDTDALARDHLAETFKKTPHIIELAIGPPQEDA